MPCHYFNDAQNSLLYIVNPEKYCTLIIFFLSSFKLGINCWMCWLPNINTAAPFGWKVSIACCLRDNCLDAIRRGVESKGGNPGRFLPGCNFLCHSFLWKKDTSVVGTRQSNNIPSLLLKVDTHCLHTSGMPNASKIIHCTLNARQE